MSPYVSDVPTTRALTTKLDETVFRKRVRRLRKKRQSTDVTLVAGDVRLPCHRAVLAATSEYFNAMFSSDLVEATSDTVRLETDPETLRDVIDYIYHGDVCKIISYKNVQNLVKTSDFFLLDKLKTACERFLMRHLQFSKVIELHRLAKFYGLAELRRKVCQQFNEFVPSAEFSALTGSELAELIDDDWLAVPDEDAVLEAVLKWARRNFKKRQSDLANILARVRFYYCTSYYMSQLLKHRAYLTEQCRSYLEDALGWHGLVKQREHQLVDPHVRASRVHQLVNPHVTASQDNQLVSPHVARRTQYSIHRLLVVAGGRTEDSGWSRECLKLNEASASPEAGTSWQTLTQLPLDCGEFFSVCPVTGGLMLTGQTGIWFYNMFTEMWETKGWLKIPRTRHASVLVGDAVYILGGIDRSLTVVSSVERLEKVGYRIVAHMPQPVTHPMAASYGDGLYVFGGIKTDNVTSHCTRHYDTSRNTWRTLSDMPEECRLGAVVVGSAGVFVVGGSTRSCLLYKPDTDTWTTLNRPTNVHSLASAAGWNKRILLAGRHITTRFLQIQYAKKKRPVSSSSCL